MRTRQKRVATDTWRSLGCRTTPLEHWSKRKPTVEPRWAKQQTKLINGAFVNNQSQQSSKDYSNCGNIGSNMYIPNMFFLQQSFGGFSFGNQGSFPTPSGSPTLPHFMSPMPPKDLETNVNIIDNRLSTVENSCTFIGKQYDDHKREIDDIKSKLKSLKGICDQRKRHQRNLVLRQS